MLLCAHPWSPESCIFPITPQFNSLGIDGSGLKGICAACCTHSSIEFHCMPLLHFHFAAKKKEKKKKALEWFVINAQVIFVVVKGSEPWYPSCTIWPISYLFFFFSSGVNDAHHFIPLSVLFLCLHKNFSNDCFSFGFWFFPRQRKFCWHCWPEISRNGKKK